MAVEDKVLLSADGFQVRSRTGFNAHPVSCHVTITEDEFLIATRRLGCVRIPITVVEEIVFDTGDAKSRVVGEGNGVNGISALIIKMAFGCGVALPPSWMNAEREIQVDRYFIFLLFLLNLQLIN